MTLQEIVPGDRLIDSLRQWLLLQKQARDWHGFPSVLAINSMLTTGSNWVDISKLPEIFIGEHRIPSDKIENLTGSCTVDIDPKSLDRGTRISIRRSSPSPAWGGVISQTIRAMKEIETSSCQDISIRKSYLIINTMDGHTRATDSNIFNVGDKVQVNLALNCSKDMDFVVINDERCASFEPSDILSGSCVIDGIGCYRETGNSTTNFFLPHLKKGHYLISYEGYISEIGRFSAGIATVQCLYAPAIIAHTKGEEITVSD